MRTTIRLDDALLAEAKELAARTGRSLTEVVEDALRLSLASAKEVREGGPARFPTVRGGGLQPGVDLDDNAALLSLMEEHE
jgi:ribbon-helix-helix CopG family protein